MEPTIPPGTVPDGPSTLALCPARDLGVAAATGDVALAGKPVCLIIPDDTRGCPMPRILRAVYKAVAGKAASLTCIIALGTHEYMEPDEIALWAAGGPQADLGAVYPGMPIGQLIYFQVEGVIVHYYNLKANAKYHQRTDKPVERMMWKDSF